MKYNQVTENTYATKGRYLVERDVLNAPSVKQWVIEITQRVQTDIAKKWFQSQLFTNRK